MSGTTRALAVKSNTLVPHGIAYAINGLYSCRSQEDDVAQGENEKLKELHGV
jgi:hypothetical protein